MALTPLEFAQQQVELLQGAITKLNTSPYTSVNFNWQSFQKADMSEYLKALAYWENKVADLSGDPALAGDRRRIPIQFVNPYEQAQDN